MTFGTIAVVCLLLFTPSFARAATMQLKAGDDLQAALNAAEPGDEIVLSAGARFVGVFRLPAKRFGPLITIRSSAALPERRVMPADAALMPVIGSGSGEAALTGTGVSQWKLDGLRFESNKGGHGNIIELQDASNVTLDRLLIAAGPEGQKRAILGNGRHITLTRSHIENIWQAGTESHAFLAYDGAGPYTITNNYLEAASVNVMFGGADSSAADRVPADILVEGNHCTKRLEWKGQPRVVKNLFELKAAKRVIVRNNVFERNWTDGQSGTAIVFTGRNQDGRAPWSVVEDVLFERNIVRDTESGFNVLGYDDGNPSGRTTGVTIRHNLVVGSRTFLTAGGEVGTLTIDHNTIDQGGNLTLLYRGAVREAGSTQARPAQYAVEHLTFTNNLANHNDYGAFGDDVGIGTPALTRLTRTFTWTHNVLAGGANALHAYPAVTLKPSAAEHRAQLTAEYTLVPNSKYRKAGSDGQDLGVVWPPAFRGSRPRR